MSVSTNSTISNADIVEALRDAKTFAELAELESESILDRVGIENLMTSICVIKFDNLMRLLNDTINTLGKGTAEHAALKSILEKANKSMADAHQGLSKLDLAYKDSQVNVKKGKDELTAIDAMIDSLSSSNVGPSAAAKAPGPDVKKANDTPKTVAQFSRQTAPQTIKVISIDLKQKSELKRRLEHIKNLANIVYQEGIVVIRNIGSAMTRDAIATAHYGSVTATLEVPFSALKPNDAQYKSLESVLNKAKVASETSFKVFGDLNAAHKAADDSLKAGRLVLAEFITFIDAQGLALQKSKTTSNAATPDAGAAPASSDTSANQSSDYYYSWGGYWNPGNIWAHWNGWKNPANGPGPNKSADGLTAAAPVAPTTASVSAPVGIIAAATAKPTAVTPATATSPSPTQTQSPAVADAKAKAANDLTKGGLAVAAIPAATAKQAAPGAKPGTASAAPVAPLTFSNGASGEQLPAPASAAPAPVSAAPAAADPAPTAPAVVPPPEAPKTSSGCIIC